MIERSFFSESAQSLKHLIKQKYNLLKLRFENEIFGLFSISDLIKVDFFVAFFNQFVSLQIKFNIKFE